jgi:hypothetical protein
VGARASTSAPAAMAAPAGDPQLVGLRLIIQPSPRKQQLSAVLRKSAVRIVNPATAAASAAKCHDDDDSGRRVFVAGLEFLKRCSCCHRDLDATMDVFVYKIPIDDSSLSLSSSSSSSSSSLSLEPGAARRSPQGNRLLVCSAGVSIVSSFPQRRAGILQR